MKAKAILNVAIGERYMLGQRRLLDSIDEPHFVWRDWPGASHQDAPYGFKIDAFDFADRAGYAQLLWCDASVWAVRSRDPVWAWLDEHSVLLLGDGWNVGQWTSDEALAIYGVSRDQAMSMQLCYACVVGIDVSAERGRRFLDRWRELRERGAFIGPWRNDGGEASADSRCLGHRHDQSAASFIAWEMGIPMAPMPVFLSIHETAGDPVFRARGL